MFFFSEFHRTESLQMNKSALKRWDMSEEQMETSSKQKIEFDVYSDSGEWRKSFSALDLDNTMEFHKHDEKTFLPVNEITH